MAARQPNVLVILTDQQTLRAMSAAGNPHLRTPAMDAIAAAGVRFERSYCASPVCGPARAAIMSGRLPHEAGVNTNGEPLAPETVTLGDAFRAAGYEAAYAGLWHIRGAPVDVNGRRHGFENLPVNVVAGAGHLGEKSDAAVADAAIAFLRRKRDRPFLLCAALVNPHDICYWVRRGAASAGNPARFPPLPDNFPRDPDEPEFVSDCRQRGHYGNEANWTWDWNTDRWRAYLDAYYRMTEDADVQVGRMMQALRDAGLERETLVVFTCDHGDGAAAHQWVVKLMLYEEPVTVPLLLSMPGVIAAGTVDHTHLASGIDVFPTICDYAGVPVPEGVTGVSLRPIIERPELPGRPYVVTELQPDSKDDSKLGRMVRTSRYKYMAFSYGRNPEMLFDLGADPGELRNLAHAPEMEAVLREHREVLARWVAQTHDRFPMDAVRSATHTRGDQRPLKSVPPAP